MNKKKILFIVLLATFCIFTSYQPLLAAEKIVKLTVPGCVWEKTAARVGSILKAIDGVSNIDTDPKNHTATATFDNEKTNLETMKKSLADGGFTIEGKPLFLNWITPQWSEGYSTATNF